MICPRCKKHVQRKYRESHERFHYEMRVDRFGGGK